MKKILFIIIFVSGLAVMGCANTGRYNTQKGAAMGAGLGALAGQAIGQDTQSTVIGTGVGALLGSIVGNSMDQQADEYRSRETQYQDRYDNDDYDRDGYTRHHDDRYYGEYTEQRPTHREPPPGRWVMVPGHWEGRHWIPSHEVWRPVNPH